MKKALPKVIICIVLVVIVFMSLFFTRVTVFAEAMGVDNTASYTGNSIPQSTNDNNNNTAILIVKIICIVVSIVIIGIIIIALFLYVLLKKLNILQNKKGNFMYCSKCGTQNKTDDFVCSNCGNNLENKSKQQTIEDFAEKNTTRRNLNGIILSDDEIVVRTYFCSQLTFPKCAGDLSVTNRRVLFHGYGNGSRIVDEMPVDAVSGISTFYGRRVSIGNLIVGIVILIISLLMANNSSFRSLLRGFPAWIVFVGIIGGLAIIAFSFHKAFFLKIYSSKASATPIHIGEGGGIGNTALYSVVAEPTKYTDKMMLELGALISDIQTGSDWEKWKE